MSLKYRIPAGLQHFHLHRPQFAAGGLKFFLGGVILIGSLQVFA
jgi:hypothetical protein